jgi:hypothetical protein
MTFEVVEQFEKEVADYFGAPYAVATDCCTHAIELCLRHTKAERATVPKHTYVSIPMTLEKLNIDWGFNDEEWSDSYYIKGTNIIDAAVLWRENSYVPNTFMCLSFQFKKHLSLGRGGIILCDNKYDQTILKMMSYDGRMPNLAWSTQNIKIMGYHYYMTPETAQLGLEKLSTAKEKTPVGWTWEDYPDLSKMDVFNDL